MKPLGSKLSKDEMDKLQERLDSFMTCSICGQPKAHHRLYGYRCINPEHAGQENLEMEFKRDTMRRGSGGGSHVYDESNTESNS